MVSHNGTGQSKLECLPGLKKMKEGVNIPKVNLPRSLALTASCKRDLTTVPSIVNSIKLLSQHGIQTDVFIDELTLPRDLSLEKVRYVVYQNKKDLFGKLWQHFKHQNYDFIISYHFTDFIVSSIVGQYCHIPVIYYNLEVLGEDEIKSFKLKVLKKLEVLFHKKAWTTVVQDETRWALLRSQNNFDSDKVVFIPNSYIGTHEHKSNYLRKKYNIPVSRSILLYIGEIAPWSVDDEFFEAIKILAESDYAVVIHGWSRGGLLEEFKKSLISANGLQINFSTSILSEEEFSDLVSSADIGLAWYKEGVTDNVRNIGLSSGRFAQFLRCGIPIVVPAYMPDFKNIIQHYKIGETVENGGEIGLAAGKILSDYDQYRNNAFLYFKNHLDFEVYFENLLKILSGS